MRVERALHLLFVGCHHRYDIVCRRVAISLKGWLGIIDVLVNLSYRDMGPDDLDVHIPSRPEVEEKGDLPYLARADEAEREECHEGVLSGVPGDRIRQNQVLQRSQDRVSTLIRAFQGSWSEFVNARLARRLQVTLEHQGQ